MALGSHIAINRTLLLKLETGYQMAKSSTLTVSSERNSGLTVGSNIVLGGTTAHISMSGPYVLAGLEIQFDPAKLGEKKQR